MTNDLPKYLLVEEHLKEAIANNTLQGKLPGERILAQQYNCSYMTLRKAIDNLVNQHVLYKIPSKGTYINDNADDTTYNKPETNTIGYFLDKDIVAGISSPSYSLIFQALEHAARQEGYGVVYISDVSDNLDSTLSRVDGVVASCFPRVEPLLEKIVKQVPVVAIDNAPSNDAIASVIIDNVSAQKESVIYLNQLGHTRIGFMSGLDDSDVGWHRYTGYCQGLEACGVDIDESMVFRGNYSFEAGIEGGRYFIGLKNRPTAVLCANDSMALGMIQLLSSQNIRVPDQISVMGFDDIEISNQIVPPLSTISAPIQTIAQQAFRLLICQMKNQEAINEHIALPAQVISRQTTARVKERTKLLNKLPQRPFQQDSTNVITT